MATIKKNIKLEKELGLFPTGIKRAWAICRCGKAIVSVGEAGTSWMHQDYDSNCVEGSGSRHAKEANGQKEFHHVEETGLVIEREIKPARNFEREEIWWIQPERKPRTLYKCGRIVGVHEYEVTLMPLTEQQMREFDLDAKWNITGQVMIEHEWVKEKVKA